MKKLLVTTLFAFSIFLFSQKTFAQDSISIPDTLKGWDSSWVLGLNGSQASYSNWANGGINSIAVTGNSEISGHYRDGRFAYGYLLSTRYGRTRIEGQGTRKIDDLLLFMHRFQYDLSDNESNFSLFLNLQLRTQFDEGFEYDQEVDGEEQDVLISRFFAPAYFTENAGIAYIPSDNFSVEAGIGLQQTYIRDEDLSETYGLGSGETFRSEAGLTFASDARLDVAENVSYQTSLQLFSSLTRGFEHSDIYFTNELVGTINNHLNANLRLDLVYDKDFSTEIQVAQVLSLGITYTL
jgi:hypothetical protein